MGLVTEELVGTVYQFSRKRRPAYCQKIVYGKYLFGIGKGDMFFLRSLLRKFYSQICCFDRLKKATNPNPAEAKRDKRPSGKQKNAGSTNIPLLLI